MGDLISILQGFIQQPAVYLILVFIYAILVALILPIPIEFALVWPFVNHDVILYAAVAITTAVGKAIGAIIILQVGIKVEKTIQSWKARISWFGKVVHYLTLFVKKTGNLGIYIILSVPLMTDTVPIYIYSLFHEEGKAPGKLSFGVSNFLAAINRAVLIALVISLFGVTLA